MNRLVGLLGLFLVIGASSARAQTELLDELDERLRWSTANGLFQTQLSGLFDLEGYWIDEHPPGLIFGGSSDFANPRLWLFLDTRLGDHLYSLVEARADRGFDPREEGASARVDEYLLRYTPFDDARLNLQIGKFSTLFGNWAARHDSWENPLINAPLPYENVTIAADSNVAATPADFLSRRNVHDKKHDWLPIVWGPSDTSGAAVFGQWSQIEYGIELANASLASRPSTWDFRHHGWDHPTVTGRLGWHPQAAWTLGASASTGSYLSSAASANLPPGKHIGDFDHTVIGADAAYSWRHWQIWGEFFASRFEVPNVEDADCLAYYFETKYQLTPEFFVAMRWNEQFFAKVDNGSGREIPWDRDIWRIDSALGYRFDRHLQAKLQYGLGRQSGRLQQGEQLVATQVTVRF
jgi:hypothetical protein